MECSCSPYDVQLIGWFTPGSSLAQHWAVYNKDYCLLLNPAATKKHPYDDLLISTTGAAQSTILCHNVPGAVINHIIMSVGLLQCADNTWNDMMMVCFTMTAQTMGFPKRWYSYSYSWLLWWLNQQHLCCNMPNTNTTAAKQQQDLMSFFVSLSVAPGSNSV